MKLINRWFSSADWLRRDRVLAVGELAVDPDKAIVKVGDGVTPWSELPGLGHREVYDIRDYGPAISDGDDITAHIVATIAAMPAFATLYIPAGDFVQGPVTVTKPIHLTGAGRVHTRLRAASGSTGYLWTFPLPTDPTHIAAGHGTGVYVENLFLDGGGRVDDVGGIEMLRQQYFTLRSMNIRHFQRSGLLMNESNREGRIDDVYFRHCGTPGTYPQLDLSERTSLDGANNIHITGCFFVYPHGDNVRIAPINVSNPTRNLYFTNCMFHGYTSTASASLDGYTYPTTDPTRGQGANILIQDARLVYFQGVRLHTPGLGHPNIRVANRTDGGSAVNIVHMSGVGFGSAGAATAYPFTASTSDTITAVGHFLTNGAMVRVSSGGTLPVPLAADTDYWVTRTGVDTFTLATSYVNAMAGTAINITDTGSGVHTVTAQQHGIEVDRGRLTLGSNITFDVALARQIVVKDAGTVKAGLAAYIEPDEIDGTDAISTSTLDVEWESTGIGPVIRSPDNTRWRLEVSDAGTVSATEL